MEFHRFEEVVTDLGKDSFGGRHGVKAGFQGIKRIFGGEYFRTAGVHSTFHGFGGNRLK